MAGAIDLFAGSSSITGTNLFKVDKDPLQQLDEGVDDVVGKQAQSTGGQFTSILDGILKSILGTPANTGTVPDLNTYFANIEQFLGSLNPLDPNFLDNLLTSAVSFISNILHPTNMLAPIVSDPNSSGGVSGFVPLENMAVELLTSLVGGAQSVVDAILASIGIPAGSGTTTQVDQFFSDLLSMLSNPALTSTATPGVRSTGAWSGVVNTSSLSIPKPTGGAVADVDIVLVWVNGTAANASPPAGSVWPPGTWPFATSSGSHDFRLWVWALDVTTMTPGNYTVGISGGGAFCHGIAVRVGATQPAGAVFDGAPVPASAAGSAATPPVTADTTSGNDLVLWASWKFSGSASHVLPSGYTSVFGSTGGTGGDTTGASAQLMAGYQMKAATGSTGAVSGSWDTADNIAAMLIPMVARSAFNPVAAIEDFIANMLHPTNMLAPLDPSTQLIDIDHIPTDDLGRSNIFDIQALLDSISNALIGAGAQFFSTTQPQARSSLDSIFGQVSDNVTMLQVLQSANISRSQAVGVLINIDFSQYPDGPMPSIFTLTYSGSGTSTLAISGGKAGWHIVNDANRSCVVRYNVAPTATDWQIVAGSMASAPPQGDTGGTPRIWVLGRMNAAATDYVWARGYSNGFLSYVGDIGYTVGGVDTVWRSGVNIGWNLSMRLFCGANGNPREYQVFAGTTLIIDYVETGTGSQMNSSHRYWGSKSEMKTSIFGGVDPGQVAAAAVTDNQPATSIGSTFRTSRASTGTVTIAAGNNFLPANFFDTVERITDDMTWDSTVAGGVLTINTEGTYLINCRYAIANLPTTNKLDASVYASYQGGSFVLIRRLGGSFADNFTGNSAYGMNGSAVMYFTPGDRLTLGTVATSGATTLTGSTNGEQTYFEVALMNRSLA